MCISFNFNSNRQGLIDLYNSDAGIFVFLLSTKAGESPVVSSDSIIIRVCLEWLWRIQCVGLIPFQVVWEST